MIRYLIILVIGTLGINVLFAQIEPRKCATHLLEEQAIKKNPKIKEDFEASIQRIIQNRKLSRTTDYEIVTIPVVVHVLHPNLGLGIKQNLKDEVIKSQIDVLNKDFRKQNSDTTNTPSLFKSVAADTKIQFCLATVDPYCNPTNGIVRIANAKASYDVDLIDTLKKLSYWPSDEYLNIWITDLESGYIGYAKFPYGTNLPGLEDGNFNQDPRFDGVVIDYTTFGNTGASLKKNYNLGRTATHEIGHWLGLRHTWGDDNCGDDYCNDTPVQNTNTDACNRAQTCDGSSLAMMENFLDYTYDACMSLFTKDQSDRIRAVLEQCSSRKTLIAKNSCAKIPETSYNPDFEGFENDTLQKYILPSPKSMIASIGAYGDEGSSFYIKSDTSFEIIQTPKLQLSNPRINYLNFDVALLNKSNQVPDGDLVISYQLGCSGAWINFVKFSAAQLVNAAGISQNLPIKTDWKNKLINLSLIKSGLIKLKFEYINRNHTNVELYLDNLLFSENKSSRLEITFDDSNKKLIFSPKHIGLKDLDVNIYSTEGKLVYEHSYSQISATTLTLTDIINPNEIYIVKATYDDQQYTYRFLYVQQ